jgi:hypothetical protein
MQGAAAAATSPPLGAGASLSGVADLGGAALLHGSASLDSDFLFGAGLVRTLKRRARAFAVGFAHSRTSYRAALVA